MEMWINTEKKYSFSGLKNNNFNLKTLITSYHKLPPTKKYIKKQEIGIMYTALQATILAFLNACMYVCVYLKNSTIGIALLCSFGRTFKISTYILQWQVQY